MSYYLSPWRYRVFPGRLRLHIPELRRDPVLAARLQEKMTAVDGVKMTEVNRLAGRALIIFRPFPQVWPEIISSLSSLRAGYRPASTHSGREKRRIVEPEDLTVRTQALMAAGTGGVLGAVGLHRALRGARPAVPSWLFNTYAAVSLISNYPWLRSGLGHLSKRGRLNHDLLLSAASFGLLIMQQSVLGLWVIWLNQLSTYLQSLTLHQAGKELQRFLDARRPAYSENLVYTPGGHVERPGKVLAGKALVDESAATGRPFPVVRARGERLLSGSRILSGQVKAAPEKETDEFDAEMEGAVRQSSGKDRHLVNRYAERISVMAALSAVGSYLLSGDWGRSLAVLLAASPSAASISVDAAYRFGLARAGRSGALFKNLESLELLTESDLVIFDKTGTLTTGELSLEKVVSLSERYTPARLLQLVLDYYRKKRAVWPAALLGEELKSLRSGAGRLSGQGKKSDLLIGDRALMEAGGIDLSPAVFQHKRLLLTGYRVLFLAAEGRLIGLLGAREKLRPEAGKAVAGLRAQGIDTLLVSGDNQEATELLGRKLGIGECRGELSPRAKGKLALSWQEQGRVVTVIGDGINDLPAIQAADVGVVLPDRGEYRTLAKAQVVLSAAGLASLPDLFHLARLSSEVARQNLIIAAGFNFYGLALALGGYATPLASAVISSVGSLSVLANSARLLRRGRRPARRSPGRGGRGGGPPLLARRPPDRANLTCAVAADQDFWFEMAGEQVVAKLGTDATGGLTLAESGRRLQCYGPNSLRRARKRSLLTLFWSQFQNQMTRLLLVAGAVSLLIGQWADGACIILIVTLEAVIGMIQEHRADQALAALSKLAAPTAVVIREGIREVIPAARLVPGDLVCLEAGCLVPADCRLLEVSGLEVKEDLLTGEAIPVSKRPDPCHRGHLGLADQNNLVFMGTTVTRGRALAVVTATGRRTEMGKIAAILDEMEKSATPLQKQLELLGRRLALLCIGVCGAISVGGILRGRPGMEMVRTGVSLAVGAIPEGLSAIVTIALAFGVQRMARRKAVVRSLPAVETIAHATVICTDKTGTLTSNQMTVTSIYVDQRTYQVTGNGYQPEGTFLDARGKVVDPYRDPSLIRVLAGGVICNNADLYQDRSGCWTTRGDPTETALLTVAAKAGLWRERLKKIKRLKEIPFEAERRLMAVVVDDQDGGRSLIAKGAPAEILALCTGYYQDEQALPLTLKERNAVLKANEVMTGEALRVIAVACKRLPAEVEVTENRLLSQLNFAGLVGMSDPPRPEVLAAVAACKEAGIRVVMITGDQKQTAVAIAKKLRIYDGGLVLAGHQLDLMDDQTLRGQINRLQVLYRAAPQQKLRVIRAFKSEGQVVVMTGDGANDAPAVAEADVGIAMGRGGTDVTRQASAITLTDDSFATIVAAVEEGRSIRTNIRQFIRYVLSGNLGEVAAVALAGIFNQPLPLEPGQILWINLVTEGIPALALGMNSPGPGVMEPVSANPGEPILGEGLAGQIAARGSGIGLTTAGIYTLSLLSGRGHLSRARTMAFANLVTSQLFHAFDCSSGARNRYLPAAAALSGGLLLGAIYLPWLRLLLKTSPLGLSDWAMVLVSSGIFSRFDTWMAPGRSPSAGWGEEPVSMIDQRPEAAGLTIVGADSPSGDGRGQSGLTPPGSQ